MSFQIVAGDITKMETDAIVNAANVKLQMGGGVCGAIFRAAGEAELQEACNQIGRCETGSAVMTDGFLLPAKYIIHAVGPIWIDGHHHEAEQLKAVYENALTLAYKHQLTSIAFPLISSGIYGYPKEEALQMAIHIIQKFLETHEMKVYLVGFDPEVVKLCRDKLDVNVSNFA